MLETQSQSSMSKFCCNCLKNKSVPEKRDISKKSDTEPKLPMGNRLTCQGLQTKIFSPRQASNRRLAVGDAPILTTGGVN